MAPTQFFIFQDFWPLLKLCQITGLFPCKKVTDENGCINLKPMKTWMLVLLLTAQWLIIQGPPIGILVYLESETEIITAFINDTMASSTLTRVCVTGFLQLSIMILTGALIMSNITSLRALCYLQDEFIIMFGRIRTKNSSIKKAYLLFGVLFGFVLMHAITNSLAFGLPMLDFLGDGRNDLKTLTIAFIFYFIPASLSSFFPLFQGLILHLQLCSNVKMIMNKSDFDGMTCSQTVLENAIKIWKTVRMSSDVLSSNSLILVLNALIILICESYLCMDYALSSANQSTALPCASNIFGALAAVLALWILNGQSEEIKQIVSNLKDTLGDIVVSNGKIQIDGRFHSEVYARGHLINKLAEFQGLDAYGYATLGKPLLTSVFANFITYLIILIQFKISIDQPVKK